MDPVPPHEPYTSTDPNSPESSSLARRRSTISSTYTSTTSSSSPELTTDTVITPESDDEDASPPVVPKLEELDEDALDEIDEAKPVVTSEIALPGPRKRGRPRKNPIIEQKRTAHARSKTGCGTCVSYLDAHIGAENDVLTAQLATEEEEV